MRNKFVLLVIISLVLLGLPKTGSLFEKGSGVRSEPDDSIFVGENPFSVPKVHVVKFYFSDSAVATLRAQNNMNAPRVDAPGKMVIDGEVYDNVAVHLRGGIGSFRTFDDKPGLRVDLNKFVSGRRYKGLAELSFHNSVQDASYICEYIGYYIWRLAGIPAPEVTWAKVYINDVYKGLYYIKEVVDKDFLKRWFYNPDGNLYKAVTGTVSDFNIFSPSAWELKSGRSNNDRSDLMEVANAVNRASTPQQLMDIIWDYVDQENYITNWVLEDLTNHWDGYVQQSWNNDLYIYHDPTTNKFFIIPHGADQLFQEFGMFPGGGGRPRRGGELTGPPPDQFPGPIVFPPSPPPVQPFRGPWGPPGGGPFPFPEIPTEQVFQGPGRPVIRTPVAFKLYQDPRFKEMLKKKRLEILRAVWDAEKLCAKIDEIRKILRKEAPEEINAGEWRAQQIKEFIKNRASSAMEWQ